MTKDEELTLEALKLAHSAGHGSIVREMKVTPFTIKEALAQPEQEPCGHLHANGDFCQDKAVVSDVWPITLYTTPPKRPWSGLTDEETADCFEAKVISDRLKADAKRIEAKLKEKNT